MEPSTELPTEEEDAIWLELKELQDSDRRLCDVTVIEAARNPDSRLHRHFEWDDTKAARAYRQLQCEALLCRIRVERVTPSGERARLPVWVRERPKKAEGGE